MRQIFRPHHILLLFTICIAIEAKECRTLHSEPPCLNEDFLSYGCMIKRNISKEIYDKIKHIPEIKSKVDSLTKCGDDWRPYSRRKCTIEGENKEEEKGFVLRVSFDLQCITGSNPEGEPMDFEELEEYDLPIQIMDDQSLYVNDTSETISSSSATSREGANRYESTITFYFLLVLSSLSVMLNVILIYFVVIRCKTKQSAPDTPTQDRESERYGLRVNDV